MTFLIISFSKFFASFVLGSDFFFFFFNFHIFPFSERYDFHSNINKFAVLSMCFKCVKANI